MAIRSLILGSEAACGTNAAGASTFGTATVVRLVNTGTTVRLVSVIDSVGGSTTIGTFSLPGGAVEHVEKQSAYAIFAANAEVKGCKVGYSG
tara:strand:+ start:289 stop:564 length:276 start_codon:yes stop_codon:yes gene_type:complete